MRKVMALLHRDDAFDRRDFVRWNGTTASVDLTAIG